MAKTAAIQKKSATSGKISKPVQAASKTTSTAKSAKATSTNSIIVKENKSKQAPAKAPAKKDSEVIVKKGDIEVKKVTTAKAEEKSKKAEKAEIIENVEKVERKEDKADTVIEKKLKALISLQQIDSQIDKIRIIRGELPLEVQDLEDEVAGIQTRIENYVNETSNIEETITERKNAIKQCQTLIKKYEAQQQNVRNNREYDSLSKEIEFQNLEIQLCEKRIKEHKAALDAKKEIIEKSQKQLEEKIKDLEVKKSELTDIIEETEKEESILLEKSKENQKIIEERLLTAYMKIRENARNGLAVVVVERDACGGCFNQIPPQRQLDIRVHKKIIVCEYCGRILVDPDIAQS